MRTWFAGRTRRERALLALAAAALLAFVLWFGAHRPVAETRRAAEQRHARALADHAAVARAAARLRALEGAAPRHAPKVAVAEAVAASAAAAGVTLASIEPEAGGGVQVAVGGASPAHLFPWLAALQRDYGVAPTHLTVIKDEQGALAVDASFGGGG